MISATQLKKRLKARIDGLSDEKLGIWKNLWNLWNQDPKKGIFYPLPGPGRPLMMKRLRNLRLVWKTGEKQTW